MLIKLDWGPSSGSTRVAWLIWQRAACNIVVSPTGAALHTHTHTHIYTCMCMYVCVSRWPLVHIFRARCHVTIWTKFLAARADSTTKHPDNVTKTQRQPKHKVQLLQHPPPLPDSPSPSRQVPEQLICQSAHSRQPEPPQRLKMLLAGNKVALGHWAT